MNFFFKKKTIYLEQSLFHVSSVETARAGKCQPKGKNIAFIIAAHWQPVPLIYNPGLPERYHTARLLGQEAVTVPVVSSSW